MDYTFAGDLVMPYLMTGIGPQTSTHPCAYCISASKSWAPDAILRTLNPYARQFDKWMKTLRNFFSCSKLDSAKPFLLLSRPPSPPPPPPPPPFSPIALEVRASFFVNGFNVWLLPCGRGTSFCRACNSPEGISWKFNRRALAFTHIIKR